MTSSSMSDVESPQDSSNVAITEESSASSTIISDAVAPSNPLVRLDSSEDLAAPYMKDMMDSQQDHGNQDSKSEMISSAPILPPPPPAIPLPPLAPPPIFNKKGFPVLIPPGPTEPNQTIYIRNINEKAKISELKSQLTKLFGKHGKILDIVAAQSLKKRGQAFIIFEDKESSRKALKVLQYYPLFGKPMIIQYAKSKSDAIASLDGTLEEQRDKRKEEKERKKVEKEEAAAAAAAAAALPPPMPFFTFPGMPFPPNGQQLPHPSDMSSLSLPSMPAPDLLVPNSILFIQNLPTSVENIESLLVSLFNQYPGFKEVRLVPGKNDIAFVEFESEMHSAMARSALHGYKLNDVEIRVTFAKK